MADITYGVLFRGSDLGTLDTARGAGTPNAATANIGRLVGKERIAFAGIASGRGRVSDQVRLLGQPYTGLCAVLFSPTWAPGMCIALLDTDENGYFTLQGIDESQQYLVTAFPRDGDYNERGWTYVKPVVD